MLFRDQDRLMLLSRPSIRHRPLHQWWKTRMCAYVWRCYTHVWDPTVVPDDTVIDMSTCMLTSANGRL